MKTIMVVLACMWCNVMYAGDYYELYKNGVRLHGEFKAKGNRVVFRRCPTSATPTPVASPVPTPVIPADDIPFKQELEVLKSIPKDGEKYVDIDSNIELVFSMALNGSRLSKDAFELKPVIKRTYNELILGNEITCEPYLYSTEKGGLNARNVRVTQALPLEEHTEYRFVAKSCESLVAADNGGTKLKEHFIMYFTTTTVVGTVTVVLPFLYVE